MKLKSKLKVLQLKSANGGDDEGDNDVDNHVDVDNDTPLPMTIDEHRTWRF